MYCGAALGRSPGARPPDKATPREGAGTPPGSARTLLVLDLSRADPAILARALGLSRFEAAQWARRGGYRLHRIVERSDAEREAARLEADGLRPLSLAEADVRAAAEPVIALDGGLGAGALEVRAPEGRVRVAPEDLLLVVKGPILRERQASSEVKRLRMAAPEAGFRIHLHRRSQVRAVELDPEVFAFGPGKRGSALLQLGAWAEALGRGRPLDDGFRHLTPVLAPAEPAGVGATAAAAALTHQTRQRAGSPLLLDNVRQFRFYSAWRATLERRL